MARSLERVGRTQPTQLRLTESVPNGPVADSQLAAPSRAGSPPCNRAGPPLAGPPAAASGGPAYPGDRDPGSLPG